MFVTSLDLNNLTITVAANLASWRGLNDVACLLRGCGGRLMGNLRDFIGKHNFNNSLSNSYQNVLEYVSHFAQLPAIAERPEAGLDNRSQSHTVWWGDVRRILAY